MATPTNNFIGGFHFRVRVEGINDPLNGFLKISGITSKTEPIEFKHGLDRAVRKSPGRTTFSDITLERVYSGLDEFAAWRQRIVDGEIDRRTVSIEYLKPDGVTVLRRYELHNCYPSSWELPSMDASSSATAVEKISLAVEHVVQLA